MSTKTMASAYKPNGTERCWLCLGEGDEVPPMGKPIDAHDWVKPCSCSLVAHKKCLVNWILSVDLDQKKTSIREDAAAQAPATGAGAGAAGAAGPPQSSISLNILNRIGINIRTENVATRFMPAAVEDPVLLSVKCPQCSNWLFLQNKEDRFNSVVQYIKEIIITGTKFAFYSTTISGFIGSNIAAICAVLSATGVQILNSVCPQSVQMRLLHIPARNLNEAVQRNVLTGRYFTVVGLIPIYLLSIRANPTSTSNVMELFIQTFPLLFLRNYDDLNGSVRARTSVFLLNFSRYAYNLLFSLTANRFYYRCVRTCAPSFIADRLSLDELDRIQRENEEEYEIELEDEESQLKEGEKSVWQRLLHYFKLRSKLRNVKWARRRREFENCLKYDYSSVFTKSSAAMTVFTTLIWPYAGERISTLLLSKSTYILRLLHKYAKTPDEAIFFRNLLGCCCVVVLKDLVNLYITWKKTQQLNNMHIVEFGTDEWNNYTIGAQALNFANDHDRFE